MPKHSAFVAVLFVSTAVLAGRVALASPEPDRHAKSAKQCTDELRKNQAALAATGESASAFFHRCWWQSSAGKPTPLLSAQGRSKAPVDDAEAVKAQDVARAAKVEAEKAKASADAALAKAKEETARAKAEIAAAKEDATRAKEDAAREAANARAAVAAEAAAKSQALSEAQAAKAKEVAKAKAAAKQREAAEAEAAAKTRAAAEVAEAARALDAAKAQAAAKVQAAAKALAVAKAEVASTQNAQTQEAHADAPDAKASQASRARDLSGSRQERTAALGNTRIESARPRTLVVTEPRRTRRITSRAALVGREPMRRDSTELGGAPSRRLKTATFESVAGHASARSQARIPSSPPDASPVVSMVKVHIQGVQQPIMWPVFPEFVPAFRAAVNHPIVPGFTSAP